MLQISPGLILCCTLTLAFLSLYRRLSSPLGRLEGPAISNITSLILKWHSLKGERTRYIHRLHLRYGPVVRVAPNEISFTSWAAVKEIYCSGGSGYDKTEFYDLFKIYGRRYGIAHQASILDVLD